ncbi:MAG TPA: HEPN domain-containing protein [Chitinophagaceae bacterium]|nr:HEPN domain-containing protein [Chitinophagaceae bacterium]
MEKNNNRYELIFSFVTLILSFSAFKDELKEIKINLGFYNFTLAEYLLKIVYGFGICTYLYIIERIAQQSKKLNSWKIIGYIEKAAFIFFVFIILTPILLLLAYIFYVAFDRFTKINEEERASLSAILTFGLISLSVILSIVTSIIYFETKNKLRQDEIEKEEILELENAMKLYDSNFYSQAILEVFKVLELHLIQLFSKRQINIPRHQFNFNELFNYAIKLELLDKEDIAAVHEIRKMRNTAAHLDIEHTKQKATKAINFIKYLIEKTSHNDNKNNH